MINKFLFVIVVKSGMPLFDEDNLGKHLLALLSVLAGGGLGLGAGLGGVEGGLGRVGGRGAAQFSLPGHRPGTGPAGVHLDRGHQASGTTDITSPGQSRRQRRSGGSG